MAFSNPSSMTARMLLFFAVCVVPASSMSIISSTDYLSSLSRASPSASFAIVEPSTYSAPEPKINGFARVDEEKDETNNQQQQQSDDKLNSSGSSALSFSHAKLSYFDINKLKPKGPRKNADVGSPHDATRELVSIGDNLAAGSWWCAAGGWPSPNQRVSTEVFFVLSGKGCVTDVDGMPHGFGPGDTVVLPKGWSGRWDIFEDIHKIWFVNEHECIEETSNPIRAVITPYDDLAPEFLTPQGPMDEAIHGNPKMASGRIYHVGPTTVGCWACTPGSFFVNPLPKTECFIVLDGTVVLSGEDGLGQRCETGDTIVLPQGWSGYWDVIDTVRKLWVVVD